jgi:CDP-glucose 4,6-dehydratase
MNNKKKFWSNEKVLITGHSGFIGSWLFYLLKKEKIKTYGISLKPNYKPSLFYLLNNNKKNSYIGNINNFDRLNNITKKIKPSIIIHLAAQPLVLESLKKPEDTFKTNIMGTLNILRLIKRYKFIKTAVFFTSDKVYNNSNSKKKFKETDSLGGDDPYSGSKAASEIVINSYCKTFLTEKNILILRSGNVIGGGDYSKYRIIPDIIKASLKNKILKVRNPYSVRPWQHVIDVIFIIKSLIEKIHNKKNFYDTFNVGLKKNNLTTISLISKIKKNFPVRIKINKNNSVEKKFLYLDTKKILKKFDIKNLINLSNTINNTVNWYYNFHIKKVDPIKLCDKEINQYKKNDY